MEKITRNTNKSNQMQQTETEQLQQTTDVGLLNDDDTQAQHDQYELNKEETKNEQITAGDTETDIDESEEESNRQGAETQQSQSLQIHTHRPERKKTFKVKSKYKFSLSKIVRNIFIVALIGLLSFGCVKGFNALVKLINTERPVATKSEDISITSTGTLSYERFQRGVLVANSGNVSFYNSKLECLWEIPGFDGMPVIHTNGKYALVAYTDTTNAMLITGSESTPVTGTGKIVSSYVNENGYFALVMTEDGYKNQISVFDNNGNLIYKWHSAENYITSVALSPDNKNMSAATIGFTESGFDSGIMMFDLAQNNPNAGQHQSDNLIMSIEFVSNNRLVAIGDKTTTYYRKDGKKLNSIDYNSKKLITYDVADSGRLILCFAKDDSAMSNCDIYSYKLNGKQSGHFETAGRVLSVSSCDENVLVARDSEFDLLSDNCRKLRNTSVVRDLKNSVLFNSGRDAFVISGNVAQVINVK